MPTIDAELIIALLAAGLPIIILIGLGIEITIYIRNRHYDRERLARIIKRHSS